MDTTGSTWPSLPHVGRREVLIGMAAIGLTACMPRGIGTGGTTFTGIADPSATIPGGAFALGVASGDPSPDGFVIWTRLAPSPLADLGGMPDTSVPVRWQLASDAAFTNLVADGLVTTSSAAAHSVHVTTKGLPANTTYWYRFTVAGQVSPVGKTRTAPAAGATVEQLKLVFATCQHYEHGFYTAWGNVAAEAPDLVVFLGDYIYEGGINATKPRQHNSGEITTLDAYRKRYGLYKSDLRLQAAHQAAPWVLTWDDHEVENNYAGLVPQDLVDQATFQARRIAAYQAYWEHQPIRVSPINQGKNMNLFRSVPWGSLMDLLVLDGRQYRSDQACGNAAAVACADRLLPGRTMLGRTQRDWLAAQLATERGRWSVLANQTIMTPTPFGTAFNMDQWDGYPAERTTVLANLAQVRNAVVLTGDFHAAGVADLQDDTPSAPVVGTELMTSSISSSSTPSYETNLNTHINALPRWQWFDATKRGYARADITATTFDVDFLSVDTSTDVLGAATVETSWRITDGIPGADPRP